MTKTAATTANHPTAMTQARLAKTAKQKKAEAEAREARAEADAAQAAASEQSSDDTMAGDFTFADIVAQSEATTVAAAGGSTFSSEGSSLLAGQDDGDGIGSVPLIIGGVVVAGGVAALVLTSGDDNDAPINAAPTFTSGTQAVAATEDTAKVVTVAAIDPNGDALTYAVTTNPTNGTVTAGTGGQFTYTPKANFNGTDTFVVTAKDPSGATATQTINVTVGAVNDAPTFANATTTLTTNENVAGTITITGSDVDNADLEYTIQTAATNGTVTEGADGTFTYTPNANFDGADSFVVKATDAGGLSATQTVNVTVVNVGPTNAAITVNAAGANPDADNVNTTYTVQLGNYTYTITGFDPGDKIVSPAGVPVSLNNSSFADGQVTLEYAQGGQVANVTLTGLTGAQDAQLFGTADLNTVFGAGTFA